MHRANSMTRPINFTLLLLCAGLLGFNMGGCKNSNSSTPSSSGNNSSSISSSTSPSPSRAGNPTSGASPNSPTANNSPSGTSQNSSAANSPKADGNNANNANLVTVTIYKADSECVNYVPEEIQVSSDRSMETAVGKVLEAYSSADFDLSGYRVSKDKDGVATVDFRLPPDSPRKIASLSACEQFALFGSLSETLTKNSQWQVKSVEFTERGEEIQL
jgi:hypothetical protein